jgi:hypothetical protein
MVVTLSTNALAIDALKGCGVRQESELHGVLGNHACALVVIAFQLPGHPIGSAAGRDAFAAELGIWMLALNGLLAQDAIRNSTRLWIAADGSARKAILLVINAGIDPLAHNTNLVGGWAGPILPEAAILIAGTVGHYAALDSKQSENDTLPFVTFAISRAFSGRGDRSCRRQDSAQRSVTPKSSAATESPTIEMYSDNFMALIMLTVRGHVQ